MQTLSQGESLAPTNIFFIILGSQVNTLHNHRTSTSESPDTATAADDQYNEGQPQDGSKSSLSHVGSEVDSSGDLEDDL